MYTTTFDPGRECPQCKAPIMFTAWAGPVTPRAGDLTICCECATTLVFEAGEPLTVRTLAQAEWDAMRLYMPQYYRVVQAIVSDLIGMIEERKS